MPTLTDDDDLRNVVPFCNVPRLIHDACESGSFAAAHRAELERKRDLAHMQWERAAAEYSDAQLDGYQSIGFLKSMMTWRAAYRNAVEALAALDDTRPSDTEGA